ncbi:hypothetical protein F2Q70_00037231 [Brassica cretica]|uniref:Uncharacterized protein n=1 Tax=Brassica cretica TaxID=69181 RepID=A0A8S9JZU6_BRACR|nr:hypothetical protein F2Q70_00037231 [Brassica cretica]
MSGLVLEISFGYFIRFKHKYKVNALPWEYQSHDARISDRYLDFSLESKSASIAGSVTKIGQASMNQNLMVVATKFCSLLFNLYPRFLCKSEPGRLPPPSPVSNSFTGVFMNQALMDLATKRYLPDLGVTFQTCLKNPIPGIPSPKTSGYVRFSVGNQLWLLHTVQGKCVVDRKIHLTGLDIDQCVSVTFVWLSMSSDFDISSSVDIQPFLNVVNADLVPAYVVIGAYAESSVSSFCIDSIVFCISCSPIGVDSVSIDAIMCSLVDLGVLPSIDFARVMSIDSEVLRCELPLNGFDFFL